MFAPFMGYSQLLRYKKPKYGKLKTPSIIVTCHHTLTEKSRPAHSCCIGRITGTSTDIDAKILHGSKRNLSHSPLPARESMSKEKTKYETQNPMGPSFPNPVLQAPNSARTFELNDAGGLPLIGVYRWS
jgi:hypothetical protein